MIKEYVPEGSFELPSPYLVFFFLFVFFFFCLFFSFSLAAISGWFDSTWLDARHVHHYMAFHASLSQLEGDLVFAVFVQENSKVFPFIIAAFTLFCSFCFLELASEHDDICG